MNYRFGVCNKCYEVCFQNFEYTSKSWLGHVYNWRVLVWFCAWARYRLLHGSGPLSGDGWIGLEAEPSPPSSAEVKNVNKPYLQRYAFLARTGTSLTLTIIQSVHVSKKITKDVKTPFYMVQNHTKTEVINFFISTLNSTPEKYYPMCLWHLLCMSASKSWCKLFTVAKASILTVLAKAFRWPQTLRELMRRSYWLMVTA